MNNNNNNKNLEHYAKVSMLLQSKNLKILTCIYTVEPRLYGHQCANKICRINEGFFIQKNVWWFWPGGQKRVAVITRWPYYRGGLKAGFHCLYTYRKNNKQWTILVHTKCNALKIQVLNTTMNRVWCFHTSNFMQYRNRI